MDPHKAYKDTNGSHRHGDPTEPGILDLLCVGVCQFQDIESLIRTPIQDTAIAIAAIIHFGELKYTGA